MSFAIQHEDGGWYIGGLGVTASFPGEVFSTTQQRAKFRHINNLPLRIGNLMLEIHDRDPLDAGYYRKTGRKPVAIVKEI